MGEMFSMDKTGDTKTIWDPENEDEVKAAKKSFNHLKKKGYSGFHVKTAGRKGERMEDFLMNPEKRVDIPKELGYTTVAQEGKRKISTIE